MPGEPMSRPVRRFKYLSRHACRISLVAAALILSACDDTQAKSTSSNAALPTPRIQALFKNTKTVCFGRFMVDVPESTIVAWGETDVPLEPIIYPGGAKNVKELAKEFIAELKSEKAINHNDVPLLLSVNEIADPEGTIVIGYAGFEAINYLKVNGYFKLKDDGVTLRTYALTGGTDHNIAEIRSTVERLRRRSESEVPSEPGNCIRYGFVPDKPVGEDQEKAELVQIGFRLSKTSDTHLSIFIYPSNPHYTEQDSLEWRLNRHEKAQKAEDPTNPSVKPKMLRRGARQVYDWLNGFEALSRTPEQPKMHSIHDFAMEFPGVPSNPLKPHVDVQMQTGVGENSAGTTKATLTDKEAVAVWDRITSTIRVRPTLIHQSND